MDVVFKTKDSDIATVYLGAFGNKKYVEFVESVQPPYPVGKKWVIIVSTLFGCPVGCQMCDAGGFYGGKLSADEIFSQIDYPVSLRFPDRSIDSEKFKVQFARMGEPTLNHSVLEVLKDFKKRFHSPGFIPSISTVAPYGTEKFFKELIEIKDGLYNNGRFQMQFSIHSTSKSERDRLIPVIKWDLSKISKFGDDFFSSGDQKITLNFIFSGEMEIDCNILQNFFDPLKFIVKITPVNPTLSAVRNNINTEFEKVRKKLEKKIFDIKEKGFDVILSIGETEENLIGSNCGQYLGAYLKSEKILLPDNAYTYELEKLR